MNVSKNITTNDTAATSLVSEDDRITGNDKNATTTVENITMAPSSLNEKNTTAAPPAGTPALRRSANLTAPTLDPVSMIPNNTNTTFAIAQTPTQSPTAHIFVDQCEEILYNDELFQCPPTTMEGVCLAEYFSVPTVLSGGRLNPLAGSCICGTEPRDMLECLFRDMCNADSECAKIDRSKNFTTTNITSLANAFYTSRTTANYYNGQYFDDEIDLKYTPAIVFNISVSVNYTMVTITPTNANISNNTLGDTIDFRGGNKITNITNDNKDGNYSYTDEGLGTLNLNNSTNISNNTLGDMIDFKGSNNITNTTNDGKDGNYSYNEEVGENDSNITTANSIPLFLCSVEINGTKCASCQICSTYNGNNYTMISSIPALLQVNCSNLLDNGNTTPGILPEEFMGNVCVTEWELLSPYTGGQNILKSNATTATIANCHSQCIILLSTIIALALVRL